MRPSAVRVRSSPEDEEADPALADDVEDCPGFLLLAAVLIIGDVEDAVEGLDDDIDGESLDTPAAAGGGSGPGNESFFLVGDIFSEMFPRSQRR